MRRRGCGVLPGPGVQGCRQQLRARGKEFRNAVSVGMGDSISDPPICESPRSVDLHVAPSSLETDLVRQLQHATPSLPFVDGITIVVESAVAGAFMSADRADDNDIASRMDYLPQAVSGKPASAEITLKVVQPDHAVPCPFTGCRELVSADGGQWR